MSVKYCIESYYFGTPKHFLRSEDGYSWTSRIPSDAWILSSRSDKTKSRSLLELLKLEDRQLPQLPVQYTDMMLHIVTGSNINIPWQHVLPRPVYENYFKNTIKVIEESFSELPCDYYNNAWSAGSDVLAALKPAKIDVEKWHSFLESSAVNASVLSSFKPDPRGYADTPVYNRFGTRTGRLTIAAGPNILTLKREHRAIIQTSFKSGSICSLDFRALEPRIVLAEAGRSSDAEDIYGEIAEKIFGDRQNRDAVKVAIISELYGAAKESLRARLGITQKKIDAFVKGINDYFNLSSLRSRLETETTGGKIRNRHGRSLAVDPEAKNLLINTYVQSTGVDVSLSGFKCVLDSLGADGIRPLYVLHDALILDVHPDRLDDVAKINKIKVPGYDQAFPLKIEEISR